MLAFCPPTGCLPTCVCNPNNDVGGTNGCDAGQVCREPCGIADLGLTCFDDDLVRDCGDRGSNFVCQVNRFGVIGGGCVEKDGETMVPNDASAGCSKGFCLDFNGMCKPETNCFIDPCEMKRDLCDEAGMVCVANTCGGCNAQCVKNEMVEQNASVPPTIHDCPRGECHNPDGQCEVEIMCQVDPCNGYTCAFGEICQTNQCGGCHPICAPDPFYVPPENVPSVTTTKVPETTKATEVSVESETTTSPPQTTAAPETTKTAQGVSPKEPVPGSGCPEEKWHLSTQPDGKNTCTNDDAFPPIWQQIEGYMFDTPVECCDLYFPDECIVKDTCHDMSSEETPGSECPEAKWHMSTLPGGTNTCTNDDRYPPAWIQSGHLYNTAQECCDRYFGEQCIVKVNCPTPTTTTTSTAKPITDSPLSTGEVPGANCPEDKWHMSTLPGGQNICTNDEVYPAAWNNMTGYLFDSAQACCDKFFGGDCIILDHCDCPKNWHLSTQIGDIQTCTNDREYPDGWNYNPGVLIFPSAEECCETLFGNPDCTKRDICGQKKCLDTWHVNPDDPSSGW
jgi:hypothetical protein